nr:MAG TPA: hypothetical protein [Caudoviricetes sp.]
MKVTITTNAPLSDVALGNLESFLSKFFSKHSDKLKVIRGEQSG